MKRWRHYNKGTAILIAAFGSVINRNSYELCLKKTRERYPDLRVEMSLSSRTVMKSLEKEGIESHTPAQWLAAFDREGYRRIIAVSLNLFPTDEHELLKKTVGGFQSFSLSRIALTPALFERNKTATAILNELHLEMEKNFPDSIKLYVVHGSPYLDQSGALAIQYSDQLLKRLSPLNFTCSLEGSFPFKVISDSLLREIRLIRKSGARDEKMPSSLVVVPLLLVSGRHFEEDITEIAEYFKSYMSVSFPTSTSNNENFHLLGLPNVAEHFFKFIDESINKLDLNDSNLT